MLNDIKVNFWALSNVADIKEPWQNLEQRSSANPFIGWSWISSWLESLPVLPTVIEAKCRDKVVGLGLFCEVNKRLLPNIYIRQLWLHRCGQQKYDQVWIEHNDFLLDSHHENTVRDAMLDFLNTSGWWDELYLGMATDKVSHCFSRKFERYRIEISSPSFLVNLEERSSLNNYLSDLSKNTRSQINRTKKILDAQGKLSLKIIQTEVEKLQAIEEVSAIHKDKWGNTEFGSGFSNASFVEFHKNMLLNFPATSQLYCLSLDHSSLAYIYIIKSPNTWYFYLSAIKNSYDNRVKVGLLAHALVIEDAIKNGIAFYSFLAGEARYKKSMSNTPDSPQQMLCYFKPSIVMLVRESLRKLKSKLSFKDLGGT